MPARRPGGAPNVRAARRAGRATAINLIHAGQLTSQEPAGPLFLYGG